MGETSQGQQFTEISCLDFLLPMTFCLHLPSSRDQPSMPRTWTHREARWLARSRRSSWARCSCSSTQCLSPGSCCGRMRPDRSCRSETSFLLDLPQLVLVAKLEAMKAGPALAGMWLNIHGVDGSPPHTPNSLLRVLAAHCLPHRQHLSVHTECRGGSKGLNWKRLDVQGGGLKVHQLLALLPPLPSELGRSGKDLQ